MKTARLAVGNPTGHRDQYVVTLVLDNAMLRGPLPLSLARDLAHVLRVGCRSTGRDFSVTLPKEDQDD